MVAQLTRERAEQLKALSSQLILFESRLCRKQKHIGVLLSQRETIIFRQQRLIQALQAMGMIALRAIDRDSNLVLRYRVSAIRTRPVKPTGNDLIHSLRWPHDLRRHSRSRLDCLMIGRSRFDSRKNHPQFTRPRFETSISPSSAVGLNTTSALANYATEAGRLMDAGLDCSLTESPPGGDETNLDSLNDSDSAVVMEEGLAGDGDILPRFRSGMDSVTVVRSVSDAVEPSNNKYASLRRSNGFLRRPEILETVYSVEEDGEGEGGGSNTSPSNNHKTETGDGGEDPTHRTKLQVRHIQREIAPSF
uniref:(California timema) hypothetical protein n=2 Tax=Timema TaxID=61471 RepID=A0A7R9PF54_TIMCA|nr:unnamed protein product [Timema californicum]